MEMELRSTFTFFCLLLLLLLLLDFPHISRGRSEGEDSEIYEIDYRGPETHSSAMPPPHGRHSINTENAMSSPKPRASSRLATNGPNIAKKIHG